MFEWLNDIVRGLLTLVPRLHLVRSTHRSVLFRYGKHFELRPGIHCYWPITTEIVTTPVVRQTLNLTYQSLVARDGESVVLAVTVVYEISDVVAALTTTDNIVDTIQDISHAAVKRVVAVCSADELQKGRTEQGKSIDRLLRQRLQTDLASYGVNVRGGFIAEFAKPYFVRLMGDFSAS